MATLARLTVRYSAMMGARPVSFATLPSSYTTNRDTTTHFFPF